MSDANNQFHYFRLTADDRILWGGYDAVYYTGNGVGPEYDRRPATIRQAGARSSGPRFPQLGPLAFPYRWGGAIDTTTRFTVTFGQALGGRLTYCAGLHRAGRRREPLGRGRRPRLHPPPGLRPAEAAVRPDAADPVPAGAAPVGSPSTRSAGSSTGPTATKGRRGLLLRTLDALGIGFDS